VIPRDAFVAVTPATGRIPEYVIPKTVVLSYNEGSQDFTPVNRVPSPFLLAVVDGEFEAVIASGESGSTFGFRVELRRSGVFGTVLVDTLYFDVATINLTVERCPDVTEETDEGALDVELASEEACPHVTLENEETSMPISALLDS
jgi:hypothetical protein